MKNVITKSAVVLLVSFILFACQKEQQDEVTPVPAITTINQGNGIIETIQRQPNGTSVVFSNWITKMPYEWSGFGTPTISTEFNTTSLTDAVRNNGIVLVYYEDGNVRQLPVNITENFVLYFSFMTGKIYVRFSYLNGTPIPQGLGNSKFRYVLIPPSAFDNPGNGKMNAPVDFSDYNAVCEYFGINK